MSKFDLYEQEQINKIKYFWKDWGKYIISIFIIIATGYLANFFWNSYNQKQEASVAQLYMQFNEALQNKDVKNVYVITNELEKKYSKNELTILASIKAAVLAYNNKEFDLAIKFLLWASTNTSDKGMESIAKLRLASIYIDQRKFDKALSVLLEKHEPSFDAAYLSTKGDLYIAKGDLVKAREAYKEALQKSSANGGATELLQLKIDVLGG
ncbi:MAG TPA: tetratricopeptide repeat protein [Burkholderiales bacterium]|nr:tetratricopeptide repeat protein [Burkholderiales bacterium]